MSGGLVVPWTAVVCIMLLLGQTCKSGEVNIGAILSMNTTYGKVSKIAMKAAVDEINSDSGILDGHNLSLKIHDANDSGFLGVMGALELMSMDEVAIIGPQSSEMAHLLSIFANELQVPLLSFSALDLALSPQQFPFFFQTAPNDMFQMTAIAELVSHYEWTEIIVIYTYDSTRRNGIIMLGDKFAEKSGRISYKAVLPHDISGKESEVMAELVKVKSMEAKVLILHASPTSGPNILKIAHQLGMVSDGYVWIASFWLTTILDSQPSTEILRMAQGVLTLRLHTTDSQRKKTFISRWNQLSKGSIGLNVFGLYAYDTVWLLSRAIHAFLHQGNHISFSSYPNLSSDGGNLNLSALNIFNEGKSLHDSILAINFTGITGSVWFDSARSLVNPSYDVINIVGSQLKRVGYWSNSSGLSKVAPEIIHSKPLNHSGDIQRLDNVVWPGGSRNKPRGWAFSKGWKLRVGVPRRTSFKDLVYVDNHTNEVKGYSIDVFLAAMKLLPYAVSYEFVPFGDGFQNPNYTELVRKIAEGEFDAAVGDIAIVTSRTKMADFTQPYTEAGLYVIVPVNKFRSGAWTFLEPFTGEMWAAIGVSALIVGAVIWILEHKINDEFRGHPRTQLMTVLWFSFSTLFNTQKQNTTSTLTRMVLVIWIFVIVIIQQSYIAGLSSLLTSEQLSSPIKGIDTLISSTQPIGIQVGSYAENYLNEELNIPRHRIKILKSPEEYADALRQGRVAAVVDEKPYVDFFLSSHCRVAITGHKFTKTGWGFAFKKGSPMALDISTAIEKLSDNGMLRNITDKWLNSNKRKSCGHKTEIAVYESDKIQVKNLLGLFIICGASIILALFIHCFSIMDCSRRHVRRESHTFNHGATNLKTSFT